MAPRVCAGLWSAPLFPRSMRVMTQRARMCRANETLSEALLWDELRDRRFQGTKWRRQQKMGRFVVDFFCSDHLLVVEVDGGVHRGRAEVDAQRQRALELTGVRFVRFSATEVERDVRAVLDRLREFLDSPSPLVAEHSSHLRKPAPSPATLTPGPSPTRGEGSWCSYFV